MSLRGFALLLAVLAVAVAPAAEPSRWPAPSESGRALVDEAQIFDAETIEQLESAAAHAAGRGLGVELVTLASLQRYGAVELGADGFAASLEDRFGQRISGPQRRLVVVLALSEQRLGVELGGDWGRRAQGLLDEFLIVQVEPLLSRSDYAEALELLVSGSAELAESGTLPAPPVLSKLKRTWPWLVAGFSLIGLSSLLLGGRGSLGWWLMMAVATLLYWPLALPSLEKKVFDEPDRLVRARGQF